MEFVEHKNGDRTTIEVQSPEPLFTNPEGALELMVNIGYLYETNRILVHREQICEEFFDLRSGMAGEILQKFSNYRMQLVIVGDFSRLQSKAMRDFILESNKGSLVNFVPDMAVALNEK